MKPELPSATIAEENGLRTLHLGDTPWVQGAMLLREPRTIVLEYVQRMMAWMLWRDCSELARGHAVQLGLGAGAITRFCHQVLRMEHITAVELNPAVIAACRHGFRLPADDVRLRVIECDADAWVTDDDHLQSAQVLNVDLYDHEAAAPVLDSERFYAGCRGVLDQLFLITFGTGFRGRSSLANVSATIGGTNANVSFAGAHSSLIGVDQANILIPRSVAGRGSIDVVLAADKKPTNTVSINVK